MTHDRIKFGKISCCAEKYGAINVEQNLLLTKLVTAQFENLINLFRMKSINNINFVK